MCRLGEWVGVGQADGTVSFFILGSILGGLPAPGDEALASEHAGAHVGEVTSLILLRASLPACGVEAALGCSASHDQSLIVWDLRAGAPLHKLLTANASPTTALSMELLPPYAPAAGPLAEPAVLLLAGSADGGVQVWSLSMAGPPTLRATWQHRNRTPVLAIAHLAEYSGEEGGAATLDAEAAGAEHASARVVTVAAAPSGGPPEEGVRPSSLRMRWSSTAPPTGL